MKVLAPIVFVVVSLLALQACPPPITPTTYSVTYSGNGNDGGAVPVDSNAYEQGQTVTVLGNTGSLVKSGYTFSAWNTQSDGAGTTYASGQTFLIPTGNVTLYATWVVPGGATVVTDLAPASSLLYALPISNGRTQLFVALGPELPLNEWTTWRIDDTGPLWMPINVRSGMSYTVNWDDSYVGDLGSYAADGTTRTYDGDIQVNVYLSDKTAQPTGWTSTAVDFGYTTNMTFTVATAQTVWISVQPYGAYLPYAGAFGMKITQASVPGNTTTYSWYLDGVLIGGATAASYVLDPATTSSGVHRLAAMAYRNGVMFSEEYPFAH